MGTGRREKKKRNDAAERGREGEREKRERGERER
jgi:hypothetical protein